MAKLTDEEFFKGLTRLAKRYKVDISIDYERGRWEAVVMHSRGDPMEVHGYGKSSTSPRSAVKQALKEFSDDMAGALEIEEWSPAHIELFGELAGLGPRQVAQLLGS